MPLLHWCCRLDDASPRSTGIKGVNHLRIWKFVAYSVTVTPLYDHWYQFLDSLPIKQFVAFVLRTFFNKVPPSLSLLTLIVASTHMLVRLLQRRVVSLTPVACDRCDRVQRKTVEVQKEGEKEPLSSVLIKLGLDQLVLDPFMTFFFYVFMGVLDRKSWRETKEDMRKTYWLTQTSAWKMWPLVNFIMFRYVPEHMQILFGNLVSFIWNIYRSLIVMG
jgi:hypothetical protein